MTSKYPAVVLLLGVLIIAGCENGGKMDSITVTPEKTIIATGSKFQLMATAHFTDGTTLNWTTAVNWTSEPASVATVDINGVVSGLTGTTTPVTITATDAANSAILGTATLYASDPQSLEIVPARPFMPVSSHHQYNVRAFLSTSGTSTTQDLTSQATWTSTNPSVAVVNAGLVDSFTNTTDTADIISTYTFTSSAVASSVTGTAHLTVIQDAVTDVAIDQFSPVISSPTQTFQFTATGTYGTSTANFTQSVIWTSSDPTVATIDSSGLATVATPTSAGTTKITATDPVSNCSGTASLTVY